ncbi:hypothetical protein M9H77_10275 [Catharanthus roseus]|uniref:Uncharacterized protein n=1 Tax=Catharanthus roseus TaxID=4058 RepID=A0ACC0C312_CATRO|nr:hypothetical protein M9H77_10275 [Catharanthus roseus]
MEIESLFLFNSPLFFFTLLFFSIYFFAIFIIFKNWNSSSKYEASSCFISLFHGTPAVFLALKSLLLLQQEEENFFKFSAKNTSFQDLVLEFSISYFIVDLTHYIIFIPNDILFKAHHLVTLYVLFSCRFIIHHGAVSILVFLLLAEITSPCQNTWSLARYKSLDLPIANRYYEFLSPIFLSFYSFVRGILGPFFAFKIGVFFINGGGNGFIPLWGLVSWSIVTVATIGISILWVFNQWVSLFRRRRAHNNVFKKVS